MYKWMVWKSNSVLFAHDLAWKFAFKSHWRRWFGSYWNSKARIYHSSWAYNQITWPWRNGNGTQKNSLNCNHINFQKRIIEDETLGTGPQPFLESLFPDRSLPWKIPEIPPRLQQLHDMLFERPAVYFLEPPGIWNDRFPLTPKWKIYDITFIWLFCFGFFVTVNVSQLLLHLKELISFKFKWTLQVLFINAIHVIFIRRYPPASY